MPTLFLSSHYSLDSRRLRTAAESLGWRVSRVDHPSEEAHISSVLPYAIFAPPGHALRIAAAVGHQLLACEDHWLPSLPMTYRRRAISMDEYSVAREERATMFVKPVRKGLFPAGVYRPGELKSLELSIPIQAPVYLSEPVRWNSEFRCFVANGEIAAMAPYRVGEEALTHLDDRLTVTEDECDGARAFCETLLADRDVHLPAGVVIDVGRIEGKGWAVVESNEAWASSIYSCSPQRVLDSILSCCVPIIKERGS